MVAQLKALPSRKVVQDANTMLVRMAHRGGCGCDPASGDGAGILTGMPDTFLRKVVQADFGLELPPASQYAAGNIFFPRDPAAVAECQEIVDRQIAAQGMRTICWRALPVDNSALGPASLESEPHISMLLIAPAEGVSSAEFNRELYRMRIEAAREIRKESSFNEFYVCSLNDSTLVYKGQLTPGQASRQLPFAVGVGVGGTGSVVWCVFPLQMMGWDPLSFNHHCASRGALIFPL